jgi:Fic family protein
MYNPKFNCTDKIKANLKEIERFKELILDSSIKPAIDISLKKKAIDDSVYASTAISSEELAFDDPRRLMNHFKRNAQDKIIKKRENYYEVLSDMDKYHIAGEITEELILEMHNQITDDLLENPSFGGNYRTFPNRIEDHVTHETRYTPPDMEEIPDLMGNLVEWINENSEISPLIVAGVAYYELVRIHPFVDGNGRTARALATLILCLRSFDVKRYFALDEYYNEDKREYVDALKTADDSGDLTEWLEYFIEGVLISVSRVWTLISELSNYTDVDVTINDDEIEIMMYLAKNEKVTTKNAQELLEISNYKARRILKGLEAKDVIKMEGKGRSSHFTFKTT